MFNVHGFVATQCFASVFKDSKIWRFDCSDIACNILAKGRIQKLTIKKIKNSKIQTL